MKSGTWIAACAVLTPLAVTQILQTDLCDGGWHRNGTYCYYVYEGTDVTWFEARNKCMDLESDLVSIRNEREDMFIKTIRNSSLLTWIGLRKNVISGIVTWNWTDGSEFTYGSLAWNQSVYNANRNCTMIKRNGWWRAVRCTKDNVKSFICKKAAALCTSTVLMPHSTGADGHIATVQDKTTDYFDESTEEMITSPRDTEGNINKQKLGKDPASVTIPVSAGVVVCVVITLIVVAVVIFLKRRNKQRRSRNRPQVENVYTLQPVTSSSRVSDELPVYNGVVGNGETGGTSGTADPGSDEGRVCSECSFEEQRSLQDGTDSEHGRTDSTRDPGTDLAALYAVVKKPARNLTDVELHENANYVSFGE